MQKQKSCARWGGWWEAGDFRGVLDWMRGVRWDIKMLSKERRSMGNEGLDHEISGNRIPCRCLLVFRKIFTAASHPELRVSHAHNILLCPKQSVAEGQSPALSRPKVTSHHHPVVLCYSSAKKFICVWMSESFIRRWLKWHSVVSVGMVPKGMGWKQMQNKTWKWNTKVTASQNEQVLVSEMAWMARRRFM